LRIGQKSNADYMEGGGTFLANSRFNEKSLKANLGFTDKVGTFKLFYDYNRQKLGLIEEEALEAILIRGRENKIWYQDIETNLWSSQNKIYFGNYKLDLNAAYQTTSLTHLGDVDEVEIQMALKTLTYETKLHLPTNYFSECILGFQGFNQGNVNLNDRETKLLPNALTDNYSGFLLLQKSFFEKLKFQTGVRYDERLMATKSIGTADDLQTFRPALNRNFESFSSSFGATYTFSEELLFRGNFAAAYRTPNLAEMTSNGLHEIRYEIGDQNLVPENSYESDLSLHFHNDNITIDCAGFYNKINHYIYLSPTTEKTSDSISIYRYQQSNSHLFGGESGLHVHPEAIKWLHGEASFASVIGKQKSGAFLPFIPANKLRFELRAEVSKLLFFNDAFFAANSTTAFSQNNAAPDETTTAGYTLVDISVGGNVKLMHQLLLISLSANNLFDTKYIDHLSTLKEVNRLNPGRNIALTLKIPFGSKQ
jgi:iron complex outermembrane receptor protein